MKKVILVIVIILFSANLFAAETVVKFYLQDGSSKQYKISEIGNFDFIKSNLSFSMRIYSSKNGNSDYDVRWIDSVNIDSTEITIAQPHIVFAENLWEIDSIIFVWNTCQEIQIGTQIWMCRNLDVDHYRNGDSIPEVRDSVEWGNIKTGAWCYYNNDPKLGAIFGKLYNWYAVNDPRGLAPVGWHVPSDGEWMVLRSHLGGYSSAGGKLKSTGTIESGTGLWRDPNSDATNESGFSAFPGGSRFVTGKFSSIGYYCYFWTSKEFDEIRALGSFINWTQIYSSLSDIKKEYGLSVRCIKGEALPQVPKIDSIRPQSTVTGDTITLYGSNFGSVQASGRVSFKNENAMIYSNWEDSLIKVQVPPRATSGKVSVTVNGIKSNEVDLTIIRPCTSRSTYSSDTIGKQVWMGENLDVCTYRNGDPIPEVTDSIEWANLTTGAWCYQNNDPALGAIYGKLYNWYAVNDPRGLAPKGWHLPSYGEWNIMTAFLGGVNYAGGKLKDTGTTHWNNNNAGATNSSGFTALPGGFIDHNFIFYPIGNYGSFWTSTEQDTLNAWSVFLWSTNPKVFNSYYDKKYGFSIRCIKGELPPVLPTIDIITPAKAYVGDTITLFGYNFGSPRDTNKVSFTGADAQNYISWTSTKIKLLVPVGAKTGAVSVTVNGLQSNKVNFTLAECTGRSSYSSVTIGTQVWMVENLDVCTYRNGDRIPEVTDPVEWANLSTGAWCYYNNDPAMGAIYGKLYNCYAVNDPRGLAPEGWHIPTDEEWTTLITYLGGDTIAGGKLKETGTSHWLSPNTGASNATGFTGLPGGYNPGDGSYTSIGSSAYWWTFSQDNLAISRHLTNIDATIVRDNVFHQRGCSVRCIKE